MAFLDFLVVIRVVDNFISFPIGKDHNHPNFGALVMTVLAGLFFRICQIVRLRFTTNLLIVNDFFLYFVIITKL